MASRLKNIYNKIRQRASAPLQKSQPPRQATPANNSTKVIITPSNISQPAQNNNEWKPTAILLIFLLYLFGAWFWFGFSLKGVFIIITGLITLLSIDFDKPKEAIHKPVIFAIWVILAIILIFNLLPDRAGQIYFLMISACMASLMDQKTSIIFLGVAILSMFAFPESIIGFIVMIVVFLFIYSASESVGLGLIMMIPLLMVGWLVGSGYGALISQKADSLSTQLGATTGISTEGMGDKIAFLFNDTWMLMTNPNGWYEKQTAVQGTQTDGSLALEITKIDALPSTVIARDNFDVVFEFENKGLKDAENVIIGATAETLADACGKMEGKFCNPLCIEEGTAPASCGMNRTIDKVAPQEKRFETVNFQAPECPGTYSTEAVLKYKYSVDATVNLQMISRKYYEDLLRNKKLTTAPELSEASAGPFKLSLKTSRDQPIPDTETDPGIMQKFKIYVGMVNQRAGKANMTYALLKIPKNLMLVGWDTANNQVDEGCSITYDVPDPVTKKYLSDIVKERIDAKKPFTIEEYLKLEEMYRTLADTPTNDYIVYKTVDYNTNNRIMNQNEWRYYKCNFRLVDGAKIDQIQTLFLRAELPYTYTITKKTTVNVRSESLIPAHCKKNVETLSAINPGQPKPQTKDAILDDLAYRIYYCYNQKQNRLIPANEVCGDYKINMIGCSETITAQNIYDKLNSNNKYPYYADALHKRIYFDTEMDKNLFYLDTSAAHKVDSDIAFTGNFIYRINIYYHAPLFWDDRSIIENYMTVRYTSIPTKDTAECP